MIVVLRRGTTDEQRDELVRELEGYGLGVHATVGDGKPMLHIVSGPTRRARRVLRAERVEALVPTSGPRLRRFGHRVYPYHFVRWSAAGIVIFGTMVLLAGQIPPGTGPRIRLEHPPEALTWPWYLRTPRALILAFPPESRRIAWGLVLVLLFAVLLLPWLDRTRGDGLRRRWPFVGAGLALLGAVLYALVAGRAP